MLKTRDCLNGLKEYTPGKSKQEVMEKWGLHSMVKLASNENPLGVPQEAIKAIQEKAHEIHLYPIGHSPSLTKKLSQKLQVKENQIFLANGSDEVIWLLCTAFLNPGEKVLSSVETFSEYEFCAQLLDGSYVNTPLKNGFFDMEALATQAKGSAVKMVFLCSPNNPTGTVISKEALEKFLKEVSSETMVVVDQAYVDFVDPSLEMELTDWLETFPNLVLLRTFSKMYGLAGLRVGYAISNPEVVGSLFKVKQPFNVNLLAQAAAEASLEANDFVAKTLENNLLGKQRLENLFQNFGISFFKTHANFMCFELGEDAGDFCQFCESKGLILRWLKSFKLPRHIRVTIGLPEELDLFETLLKEWKSK